MSGKIKVKEQIKAQPEKKACSHFWVIEVANGPASMGQCKYCGERKEFYNAFPEYNPLKKGSNPFSLPKFNHVPVKEEN
jgi:hypothetical protein